jgi:hypothetical protein
VEVFDFFTSYGCPVIALTNSFNFGPQQNVIKQVVLEGYWTAGETTHPGGGVSEGVLHPFLPGEYTVVAGDEWGQLLLLYFVVKT